MALIAAIAALIGRVGGRILGTSLGWANTLLFGRVPQSRQPLLLLVSLGSVAWVACLTGIVFPEVGLFLLAAIPQIPFVPSWVLRLVMLVAALAVPLLIGVAALLLVDSELRPRGRRLVVSVLRGYPFAFVLAFMLVFGAVVAAGRQIRNLVRRWAGEHIPMVVQPGGYSQVADDLEAALRAVGLDVERRPAPIILEAPSRLISRVAGDGVRSLVPARLQVVGNPNLEVLLYPSDVAMAGRRRELSLARAAIAARLTSTAAYLTSSREGQAIEERIARLGQGPATSGSAGTDRAAADVLEPERDADSGMASAREAAAALAPIAQSTSATTWQAHVVEELRAIDQELSTSAVPDVEWEVLYRMRLQVERDLLLDASGRPRGWTPVAGAGTTASRHEGDQAGA